MKHTKTLPKEVDLLLHLKKAAEAKKQFLFCDDYYENHSPTICKIAHHPDNHPKNKENFWGFPYDDNLITSISQYINASPMTFNNQTYIAAQGPRIETFNEFWAMVAAEEAKIIVSVTNERENQEGMNHFKFDRFWPDSDSCHFGPIEVLLLKEEWMEKWENRTEKLKKRELLIKKERKEYKLHHFHMENWPDNGVIHPESLIALSRHIDQAFLSGPIVVHCAAGVGRTGTFIAFHSLYNECMQALQSGKEFQLNVAERIAEMRKKRWGAMIADVKQYELLLEALEIALS